MKYSNVCYDSKTNNLLDIYSTQKQSKGTIICFHGGGIVSGSKEDDSLVLMAQSFNEKGYDYVSVNYRLYPNAKFPEYIEDGAAAIRFIKDNARTYNLSNKLVVSGHSAGAYITLMLCLDSDYLEKQGIGNSDISAWISDSAQTTSHFNVINIEEGLNPLIQRIDKYAPLYYINEKTSFHKMLLIYYSNDMPNRLEQNKLFKSAILSFNNKANIKDVLLEGNHCDGSCKKNKDNEYPYVIETIKFLEEN